MPSDYAKQVRREYNRKRMAADRARKKRESAMTLDELIREKRQIARELPRVPP